MGHSHAEGLGHVKANVGDRVRDQATDDGECHVNQHRGSENFRELPDSEEGGHAVEVVRVGGHGHDLRKDGLLGPLRAKDLGKLLEVQSGGLANGKDAVAKPRHAQATEPLIKELHTELLRQERDVLDDRKPNPPLLVLCQLHDGGEQGLGQAVNAND